MSSKLLQSQSVQKYIKTYLFSLFLLFSSPALSVLLSSWCILSFISRIPSVLAFSTFRSSNFHFTFSLFKFFFLESSLFLALLHPKGVRGLLLKNLLNNTCLFEHSRAEEADMDGRETIELDIEFL